MRTFLKKIAILRLAVVLTRILRNEHGFFQKVRLLWVYASDARKYRNLNPNFAYKLVDAYPCIYDKTEVTPVGAVYFYQDSWCAQKVFQTRPATHYDVGSKAEMVGILSQFTPVTMVDIRPLTLTLPNLSFVKGDLLNLPFADRSIASLSSICVIEHIGLGRYGDALDAFGSEKAAKELVRVLAPQGNLFISVPVDAENKIYFNAHRAFTRAYLLSLFAELELVEEKYIYGDRMEDAYDPAKGFGTGLYHFRLV